jgi:hypothetical protein
MFSRKRTRWLTHTALLLGSLLGLVFGSAYGQTDSPSDPAAPAVDYTIHLPALYFNHPWPSPFGFEAYKPLLEGSPMLDYASGLNARWARMGVQVSWKDLQPVEGGPIQWNLLATFEDELRGLHSKGITPVVVIKNTPEWAAELVLMDGQLQYAPCGPIQGAKFSAFAYFVKEIVQRYSKPEFNAHDWEIGNEPDVDPNDAKVLNYTFGCWGDRADHTYYNGDHFGEMLKVVGPQIRRADPAARIWIGGLLLANPNSPASSGKPENFLRGVLAVGAAPYIDIVAYHWHPSYWNEYVDYDITYNNWTSTGGGVVGKARYLRQLMSEYGVSKPLFLNETGFGCKVETATDPCWDAQPPSEFYQLQSDLLVRMGVRSLSENVMGFTWYTLTGPGWRYSGLLDENQTPRPGYYTYQTLSQQLQGARYMNPVNYASEVEAYEFQRSLQRVHVVWTKNNISLAVQVPQSKFVAAYTKLGVQINPPLNGSNYDVPVGFSPIYIIRNP